MAIPNQNRSGGPKTELGKANSARNSLKTGAYSDMIILPGESEEDFKELHEQFIRDFDPRDIVEGALIHDLAVLTWKKLRLDKLEHASFLRKINTPIRSYEYAEGVGEVAISEEMADLIPKLGQFEEEYIKHLRHALSVSQPFLDNHISIDQFFDLAEPDSVLFFSLKRIFDQNYIVPKEFNNFEDYWAALRKNTRDEAALICVNKVLGKLKEHADFLQKNAALAAKLKTEIAKIKEQRLLKEIQLQKTSRAQDDLSRQFFRVLSELRKQQSWRRQMGIVDVTPEPD